MIIFGGATATGKTNAGVMLAKIGNGEIISADSMQIYKHMDVGTAKVKKEDMSGIKHYMIDIVEPGDTFSVAEYQKKAMDIISDIESRKKIPIIVGGTGLYINSLIYPLRFGNTEGDKGLRDSLKNEYQRYGREYLYKKLQRIDPDAAQNIHMNNIKRVIRAIEVKLLSGKSICDTEDLCREKRYYKMYAYDMDRTALYQRINTRVDVMFKNGLVEEVEKLIFEHKVSFDAQSMHAIGYKEFKLYYNGKINMDELIELIKKHSRNYAKRQYTWFKSYND
ncbi:MAG: tRNA (adenosine(37)-N6)-dimethylallyltransferase MiaA, partial [Bacillota bacterium]